MWNEGQRRGKQKTGRWALLGRDHFVQSSLMSAMGRLYRSDVRHETRNRSEIPGPLQRLHMLPSLSSLSAAHSYMLPSLTNPERKSGGYGGDGSSGNPNVNATSLAMFSGVKEHGHAAMRHGRGRGRAHRGAG